MGGYGALRHGLANPNKYNAIGAFSAPIRTKRIAEYVNFPVDDVYDLEPYVVNTIVRTGEYVVIANVDEAIVNIYTATGQLMDTQYITPDNDVIRVASKPGVYMLQVATSTEIFTTKIIITE